MWNRTGSVVVCVLLLAAGMGVALSGAWFTPRGTPAALSQTVYVWQRQWTPVVGAAVARSAGVFDAFMVLVGEVSCGEKAAVQPVAVDWDALATAGVHVTAVLRAHTGLARLLERRPDNSAPSAVADAYRALQGLAASHHAVLRGLQLDFDCPTEKLPAYRSFVAALRAALPGVELSITALPSWMNDSEFRPLIAETDYFVLQVHCLEKPVAIDQPMALCDTRKAGVYIARASSFRMPFYIALPTYTYQVAFDASGAFTGVAAENVSLPPGQRVREMAADAGALATLVRALRDAPPPHCRGLVWFRLPVDTDRQNWSWPVLQSVMNGVPPNAAFNVEIRAVRDDLREVWVHNTGDYRPGKPLRFTVRWGGAEIRAHDVLASYHDEMDAAKTAMTLTGPAPGKDKPLLAAWFVLAAKNDTTEVSFEAGSAETLP
jgi:hypothetical protein